ncbi:hypothetical protein N7486_004326, partial [Penicillium sp. IBT 16267x]
RLCLRAAYTASERGMTELYLARSSISLNNFVGSLFISQITLFIHLTAAFVMSFGFSIGDFIAAIGIVNQLRKDFARAPSGFKALSDELRELEILVRDMDVDQHNKSLSTQQRSQLEDVAKSCRDLFADIKKMVSRYCDVNKSHGIRKTWKRLTWEPEDARDLRTRLISNISTLNAFNGRIIREDLSTLLRHKTNQKYRTCLDWLSPTTHATRQSANIRLREPGTGQWLLESHEFQSWTDSIVEKTMFCPGIPGAGKTILSSVVIDELENRYSNDPQIGIAYIYCSFQNICDGSQDPEVFLSAILRQLLCHTSPMPAVVQALYDKHEAKGTRPIMTELLPALSCVASSFRRWFLVIDALDECSLTDMTRFLDALSSFRTSDSNMSLFATSRLIPEIMTKFQSNALVKEIRAQKSDIIKYLEANLDGLPPSVLRNPNLRQEIVFGITDAVDGISLKEQNTPRDVRSSLKELMNGSANYQQAYDDAMQRIDSQKFGQKTLARRVLSWITCARRPLTTAELLHALAVDLDDSDLDEDNVPHLDFVVSICAGLVVVTGDNTSNDIIRLVHYTAQEYFERTSNRWFPNANEAIAATCPTYISFEAFQSGICHSDTEFEARLDSYPLYSYAVKSWARHVSGEATTQDLIMTFLKSSSKAQASVQAIFAMKGPSNRGDYCRRTPEGFTGLHLAAYLGLENVVRSLIQTGDLSPTTSSDRSPLGWAAYAGHASVVDLLLRGGSDPRQVDVNGRAPMSLAAYKGQARVIALLIHYQVDPNYSVEQGHEEAARVLLENNASPQCRDHDGRTPLLCAASYGWVGIAQLLLTRSADPNSQDISGQTPLFSAVHNGHDALIKVLLNHGALVELSNVASNSPAFCAGQIYHHDLAVPFQDNKLTVGVHQEQMRKFEEQKRQLKCPFCTGDIQRVHVVFASLRLHILSVHFFQSRYVCPEPSCINDTKRKMFGRRDHFAEHLRISHGRVGLTTKDLFQLRETFPSPQSCPVCKALLSSWDDFWKCVLNHA